MSVHYKFKSALDYDTVTFDGLHISVGDLKAAISQQKRIGKTSDFDLKITNAQTKEVYVDDNTLIPKNTSLLVARVPLAQQPKKQWEDSKNSGSLHKDVSFNKGVADLSRMEGSEQDKINAMITQSTFDYDPSNYLKIRGQNQRGVVPTNYTCYKCQKKGHWIKDCPTASSGESVEIRRSTGIPRSFMVPVDGPKAPGAMMTPSGTFAVPAVDHEAYLASETAGDADAPPNTASTSEPSIPDELICSLCRDLLTDAVMIPCCGNSFCDECIRGALLESEDRECPDCREKEIAPTTLIPNRFLRNSVSMFCNQTGYSRRMPHRASIPKSQPMEPPPPLAVHPNGPAVMPPSNGPIPGPPPALQPPAIQVPVVPPPANAPPATSIPRVDEQRASTPTIDERREPMQGNFPPNRGPPPSFPPSNGGPQPRNPPPPYNRPGPLPERGFKDRFPDRNPPIGVKESPPLTVPGEDPLEAFNRMIREKEMRAKRREEERRRREEEERRRRRPVGSRSRSRSPRPRSPRSPSPRPRSRSRSISPRARSRPPRSPRSPSPRLPPRPRQRYSRSRSNSPRRLRRSPWSPRRRRSRSLSLSRSPSLRRRHRSPLAYSPPPSPRSPLRAPLRTPPRSLSPHRHPGLYEELLPPSRNIEPPYASRYGPRNNLPPPGYPHMAEKPIPPLIPVVGGPPGYRGRYDAPPFDEVPPGVDSSIAGFEPSPFEKPVFGPGSDERDRLPPSNYRDPYRPPYDGPGVGPGFRELPHQGEIAVHISDHPSRFRDNYRGPPQHGREQGPFREGPPYREQSGSQPPFRVDPNYRGPPFRENNSFRNAPYREPPGNFRDAAVPFGSPNSESREPMPPNYMDSNLRDGYRDENGPRDSRYKANTRERGRGGRQYQNPDYKNHPERCGRDRDRYEEREPDKLRDPEKKYDKRRDEREDRHRNYERNREYDKERDRDYERGTPEKKSHTSPKRSRDIRERKGSEVRVRSRDRDRKDKKEDKSVDKTSIDRGKEHREKEKKVKDRKKKKREKEKEKDVDKKKKRDKKDKKDKDSIKKDDVHSQFESGRNPSPEGKQSDSAVEKSPDLKKTDDNLSNIEKTKEIDAKVNDETKVDLEGKAKFDLYGDEASEAVDKDTVQNYVRPEKENLNQPGKNRTEESGNKEEPFDGIELQANADELDLKIDGDTKEMLAPLPGLSKWEVDDDNEKCKEPGEITSPDEEEDIKVTSEVLKRAENAIFAKTISSIKPIEIKKISSDRLKLYNDENKKTSLKITVPLADAERRSIELNYKKRLSSKTPPPRISVKDRLGGKLEDIRRVTETRVLHSTVERVKSRSKTPKKEGMLGSKVVVSDQRRVKNIGLPYDSSKVRIKSDHERIEGKSSVKSAKGVKQTGHEENKKPANVEGKQHLDRKKSLLDEANFEPDYDETVESETENMESKSKRERSASPTDPEAKKMKIEEHSIQLDLTNVKKKPDTESESSSDSEDSSSSSSSEERKRKRKKKRSKKKKKRAASDSDSDSDSSDDHRKKKKKRKHKKKSSKKKKKTKR